MMLGGGGGDGIDGLILPLQLNTAAAAGGGVGGGWREERFPQWSVEETRDFIAIRAELEQDFTVSKRNRTLWELVAARMRGRGYRRSPDQCKCKWKNLVNRYKGKETSDPENGRPCPFFEELHAIFTERARNMQRLLVESESGALHSKKKLKRPSGDPSLDQLSEDDDENAGVSDEEHSTKSRKKKVDRGQQQQQKAVGNSRASTSIHDLLQEFFQQQERMEVQWHEMMDRRAQERRMFEQEWRQNMEKLERERLVLEQAWWEREEQRRIREENRAEKRDQLLVSLFNKLIQEDL